MVEAVARHGYAGTTLRELVTLAGVSKSTFYEHFESKQDCFFATFTEIVDIASQRVGEAYRQPGDIREKVVAGLRAFLDLAVEEPAAAYLATVESLTLGSAGVAPRERAWGTFELMFQQTFDSSPSRVQVSEYTVRAIVAGLSGVVYRYLRAGRREELPGAVDELADWVLSYQQRQSAAVAQARRGAEAPVPETSRGLPDDGTISWEEPPDSRRSRAALTQRERIIRAAARVVYEKGYEALSVPAISAAAGVSNQTFYQNFPSKRDAFLEAFEILVKRAFHSALEPVRDEPPSAEAVGKVLRAYLEHISANPLFARLAYFESPSVGPAYFELGDGTIDRFTAVLGGAAPSFGRRQTLSDNVLAGIGTGIWSVIQHELEHGESDSLPALAPEVAKIAVMPLG
jgi:AcrR family transcriptional regulator